MLRLSGWMERKIVEARKRNKRNGVDGSREKGKRNRERGRKIGGGGGSI